LWQKDYGVGWEAGIRTPITWSRERMTRCDALRSALVPCFPRFFAPPLPSTSMGFGPFPCNVSHRVTPLQCCVARCLNSTATGASRNSILIVHRHLTDGLTRSTLPYDARVECRPGVGHRFDRRSRPSSLRCQQAQRVSVLLLRVPGCPLPLYRAARDGPLLASKKKPGGRLR
jgi:hypothetical protein